MRNGTGVSDGRCTSIGLPEAGDHVDSLPTEWRVGILDARGRKNGPPEVLVLAQSAAERNCFKVWLKVQGYEFCGTGVARAARRMLTQGRFRCCIFEFGPDCPKGIELALLALNGPAPTPCLCFADGLPPASDEARGILCRASFVLRPLTCKKITNGLSLAQERIEFERICNARTVARRNMVRRSED